jgi:Flp pilus assembly protein TadG
MRAAVPTRPFRQRGVATLELGVLALPLMVFVFGTMEAGSALYTYDAIAKGVRAGARYLTTVAPGDATGMLAARCLALTGDTANNGTGCTGAALVAGLTLSSIVACDRTNWQSNCSGVNHGLQSTGSPGSVVALVTIKVTSYSFTSVVPFAMPSVTFGPVSATMLQPI